MVLTGTSSSSNLVDIPGSLAHADNSTLRLSQLDPPAVRHCLEHYTAFVMVRHPFERLLSAYRNKFENTYSQYFQVSPNLVSRASTPPPYSSATAAPSSASTATTPPTATWTPAPT